jgi:hypothetical protein
MARRRNFPYRYPSSGEYCGAGEDSVLAFQMLREDEDGVLLLNDLGYLNVYSYHGKNVWNIDHHLKISRERAMHCDYLLRYRSRICETMNRLGFLGPVNVMGREGLAFVHGGEI